MAIRSTAMGAGHLRACDKPVTRTEPDGTVTVLPRIRRQHLNSPNDIVVATGGSIYFTDPTYGRMEPYGVPRRRAVVPGVYRIDGDGALLTLLADDFVSRTAFCFARRVAPVHQRHRKGTSGCSASRPTAI
jgi:gluconolactonase